jgi:hypothetical protein
MTNNKQQTAVEWFGIEMGKLFAQYHGKIICIGEFHKRRFELEEQAKEMEKKITINFTEDWYFNGTVMMKKIDVKTTIEQHFNETYGGGE